MNSPQQPSSDEPTLVTAIRRLASDVIEYGEARYRLVQAEAKVSIGRFGGAASLGVVAAFFGIVGYLPLVLIAVLYLSKAWFDGTLVWPLLIVAVIHFLIASIFAAFAWRRWQVNHEINKEEIKTPALAEPTWNKNLKQ